MNLLSETELFVINWIASKLSGAEQQALLSDLKDAHLNLEDSNKFRRIFNINGYRRPTYEGQRPYSVEVSMLDKNGIALGAILFKDHNERLLELEWLDYGDSDISIPDLSTITIS